MPDCPKYKARDALSDAPKDRVCKWYHACYCWHRDTPDLTPCPFWRATMPAAMNAAIDHTLSVFGPGTTIVSYSIGGR